VRLAACLLGALAITSTLQSNVVTPDPLAQYRWTHRLIVIDVPDTAAGRSALEKLRVALEASKADVLERDLLFVSVGDVPADADPSIPALAPSQRVAIRGRIDLHGGEAELVLIGKDGGVKARQSGAFDLPRLLAIIDTMPMRRAEARHR